MKELLLISSMTLLICFFFHDVQSQSNINLETTTNEIEQVITILKKVGEQEKVKSGNTSGLRYFYKLSEGISMNDTTYTNVTISFVEYIDGNNRIATTAFRKHTWTVDINTAYDGLSGPLDGIPEKGVIVNYAKPKAIYFAITAKDDGEMSVFGNDLKNLSTPSQRDWFHLIIDQFLDVHSSTD